MDIQEFKELVFVAGKKAGLEDMEIYVQRVDNFSVRIFEKEIDGYSVSVEQGVGFRARYNGKIGYAYVEALDSGSVDLLVEGAKANAKIVDSTDEIEFYAGADKYPVVEAYTEELAKVSAEEKIDFAKQLEAEAFAADERVSMVNWATTMYRETEVFIANTKGLEQSYRNNGAVAFVMALVREGEQTKTGGRQVMGSDWKKFDAKKLAREAVEEATSLLGAASVKSGDYRVMLRYDVMANLLDTFASVFSGEAVQKGLSLLQGKVGQKVAAPMVTLIDDPLLANGFASAPFDDEGVPTRTKKVIDSGLLTTYLHNLKTAKKDGVESTGNASRASFKSPVGISPSNFYIEPGEKGYTELVKDLQEGLIIISVQGSHSGANAVSGDFSLGAYGYLVEKGKISRPVDQITIAGNFFGLLADIEGIASDLEFSPGGSGNIGAPSVIVKSLSVAGL